MHKILLIEDNAYIRDVYCEVLKDAGYDVATAVDGEEGMVMIKDGEYNLILLDLMIPKLSGIEFLKELDLKNSTQKFAPIVMLTNVSQNEVIQEGLSLGAHDYIIKSDIDPGQLLEKVKTLLE